MENHKKKLFIRDPNKSKLAQARIVVNPTFMSSSKTFGPLACTHVYVVCALTWLSDNFTAFLASPKKSFKRGPMHFLFL